MLIIQLENRTDFAKHFGIAQKYSKNPFTIREQTVSISCFFEKFGGEWMQIN